MIRRSESDYIAHSSNRNRDKTLGNSCICFSFGEQSYLYVISGAQAGPHTIIIFFFESCRFN